MIDLPPEIRSFILSCVKSKSDLLNLRLVCRSIKLDLDRPILWKGIRFDISDKFDRLHDIPNIPFDHIKIERKDLTDSILEQMLDKMNKITELDLSHCHNISNNSTKVISKLLNLRKLSLRDCENITDIGISELVSTDLVERLSAIDLSECHITTVSVILLSKCPNLKGIGLSRCFDISDVGLMEISRMCLDMQIVWIDQCSKITDEGLLYLKYCKDLRELRMMGTNISDVGLAKLKSCCPMLENVYR